MYAVKSSHIRAMFDLMVMEGKASGMLDCEFEAYCKVMGVLKTRILSEEVFVTIPEPA